VKKITSLSLCFFGCMPILLFGQVPPDSTSFISPVEHTIRLAGSFAELRSNHFHSGIDIKSTAGLDGDPILSSDMGYISRIKVESSGYGNALYIDHPNGYTTVYAHLSEFSPEIERYVKKIQNKTESFPVDIYVDAKKFNFKKGEKIGSMGNTGRSSAPHLHFEIRETLSERPVLPSKFNIKTKDTVAPKITGVYVYELDEDGYEVNKVQVRIVKEGNGYVTKPDVIKVNADYAGIGIVAYDQTNGQANKNGVYNLTISNSDSLYFNAQFDRLDFNESKAINDIIDYKHYQKFGTKIMKLFASECSPLSNYKQNSGLGLLPLSDGSPSFYRVKVSDDYQNFSTFEIGLSKVTQSNIDRSNGKDLVQCGVRDTIRLESGTKIILSEKSLYQSQEIVVQEELAEGSYSISILSNGTPAHDPFKIVIPNHTDEKFILTKVDKNGRRVNFGGYISQGNFINYLDEFGTYRLEKDLIAPSINRSAVTTKESSKQYLFSISDNLRSDSGLGDLSIDCKACGQWVLYYFDKKNSQIIIDQRDILPNCKSLLVVARDFSGNQTELNQPIR